MAFLSVVISSYTLLPFPLPFAFLNDLFLLDFSCNVLPSSKHGLLRHLAIQTADSSMTLDECSHKLNTEDPTISNCLLGQLSISL